jgi:transcriptional regulator GlxA family with amidase domain
VLFLKRPGGQSQFSAQLASQLAERNPLRELQAWIVGHPAEDLSVSALANRAFMSERNFARAFRREVGMTPAAYVEAVRVDRARMLLETSDMPVETVARECGFGTVETMRRAFARRVSVSPSDYRGRFRAA